MRKDGTCALFLRMYLNNKYAKIPLDLYCAPAAWNAIKERADGNTKDIRTLNLQLSEAEGRAADIILKYKVQKTELTKDRFIKEFSNPQVFVDFISFMADNIRIRNHEIMDSTKDVHLSVLAKLKEFKSELLLVEIDEEFLRRYEHYLRVRLGNQPNTVHNNFKIIKTYVNKAIKQGLIVKNPFKSYMPRQITTHPEFLSEKERNSLIELYDSHTLPSGQQKVLRWYIFVCYTGLRISDLGAVTKRQINDKKQLIYNPIKMQNVNNIRVTCPLTKTALRMIADEASATEKLFNLISEQKMNEWLKIIAKKADINMPGISFHSGRHTFATTFLKSTKAANGILILQKLLGHAKITQTMKYAHVITTDLEEAMRDFDF